MQRFHIQLPVLAGALLLTWLSAAESAVVRLSASTLAERSKYIVTGEVIELKSYRGPFLDLGEIIFTDVKIRVDRVLKGRPDGTEITIQVPGGEMGRYFQMCPDAPRYEKGEKVLLFLRDYNGKIWNTGWLQGKYRLIERGTVVRGQADFPISRDTPLTTLEAQLRSAIHASSSAENPAPSAGSAPATGAPASSQPASAAGGSR